MIKATPDLISFHIIGSNTKGFYNFSNNHSKIKKRKASYQKIDDENKHSDDEPNSDIEYLPEPNIQTKLFIDFKNDKRDLLQEYSFKIFKWMSVACIMCDIAIVSMTEDYPIKICFISKYVNLTFYCAPRTINDDMDVKTKYDL